MSVRYMTLTLSDWAQIHTHILRLEQRGLETRTFWQLDPEQQDAILNAVLDEAVEKGPKLLHVKQAAGRVGVPARSLHNCFAAGTDYWPLPWNCALGLPVKRLTVTGPTCWHCRCVAGRAQRTLRG